MRSDQFLKFVLRRALLSIVCSTSFVIMWSITVADLSVTQVGFVMRKKAPLLVIACRYFSA